MRHLTICAAVAVTVFVLSACNNLEGFKIGSGSDFTTPSVNPMTIDDIVTDTSFPLIAPSAEAALFPMHLFVAAQDEYYHGRFMINNGGNIELGYCSFKIVRQSSTTAYFADWKIHWLIDIADPSTKNTLEATDFDMAVSDAYNATTNFVRISDGARRHTTFSINFGATTNNIANISNASAVFTKDYSTFIGGDNIFNIIATRGTSIPATVVNSDMSATYSSFNFTQSSGVITEGMVVTDVISSGGTNGLQLEGVNGNDAIFNAADVKIMDDQAGASIYNESGNLGSNILNIDGIILLSPNKRYTLRFDLNTVTDYFAGNKL